MDRVSEICERHGLTLVEDCAHAAGVTWRGRQLGYHAKVRPSWIDLRAIVTLISIVSLNFRVKGSQAGISPIHFIGS